MNSFGNKLKRAQQNLSAFDNFFFFPSETRRRGYENRKSRTEVRDLTSKKKLHVL